MSGSGNAKSETVQSLAGAGAIVTSTITSEGALLSATPRKERVKGATGGSLRKIGDRGLLVLKDVTSILSADRTARGTVLAALREIYDGRWQRNVGTDGGQTITWTGRIGIDRRGHYGMGSAHTVISQMGDRFLLIRSDSRIGREEAGAQAVHNIGKEEIMRAEMAAVVGGLVSHIDINANYDPQEQETRQLLKTANIVTHARTAIERDYRSDVIDAHMPEMPTRFLKQSAQIVRGGLALGMRREAAMRLALRCARDSCPPMRSAILLDLRGTRTRARLTSAKELSSHTAPSGGNLRRCTVWGYCTVMRNRSLATTTSCAPSGAIPWPTTSTAPPCSQCWSRHRFSGPLPILLGDTQGRKDPSFPPYIYP